MITPTRVAQSIRYRAEKYSKSRKIRLSKQPIIVYQMGKVGSRTVVISLQSLRLKEPVFHAHFLSDYSFDRVRGDLKRDGENSSHAQVLSHMSDQRDLIDSDDGKRWKVVTLVREPISRGIGTFMASYFKSNPIFDLTGPDSERTLSAMHDLYHSRGHKYSDYEAFWFRSELESLFGVDVLSSPFDPAKGYQTYSGEAADVLLLRLEDLRQVGSDAFREFLGIDDFKVVNSNTSQEKDYRPIYDEFLSSLEFDPEFLDETYRKDVVSRFYSPLEIKGFKEKWGAKPSQT